MININNGVANGGQTPVIMAGLAASRPAATQVANGTLYISIDTNILQRSDTAAWQTIGGGAALQDLQSVLNTGNIATDQYFQLVDTISGIIATVIAQGGDCYFQIQDGGNVTRSIVSASVIQVGNDNTNSGSFLDSAGNITAQGVDYVLSLLPSNNEIRHTDINSGDSDYLKFPSVPNGSEYYLPTRLGTIQLENIAIVDNNVDLTINDFEIFNPGIYVVIATGAGAIDLTGYSGSDGTQIVLLSKQTPYNINYANNFFGSNTVSTDGQTTITYYDGDFYIS